MKHVSLKDIAKTAGVSPSTVSLILNGKAKEMRISEALSKKIILLAGKSGYTPNHLAVSLRKGETKIIGLVVESISGNFFSSVAKIIEERANACGYKIIYCSTGNNEKKGHELLQMLSEQQVDGYIITPAPGMQKDIKELLQMRKPVVLLDSYFPGIDTPYVLTNNFSSVAKGIEYLLDKGYKKIGFVTVDLDLIQMKERKKAYLQMLTSHKIKADKKLILDLQYDESKENAIQKITSFIRNNKELDAIFFATNYLGVIGLESIKSLNLKIPDDIAVLCFDDHDVFRLYPPGITIIQQPVEAIAETAIGLLMSQLTKTEEGPNGKHVQHTASLVLRNSA
ncbi:MAG: LacI family DNA-binding transcriptional regulator [Ilyomonas sp.]